MKADPLLKVILVTNSTWPDKTGGLERYFRQLGEALAERGHRVDLVAKRLAPEDPLQESVSELFSIHRYDTTPHADPLFLLKYRRSIDSSLRNLLSELGARDPGTIVHALFPFQGDVLRRAKVSYVYTCAAPVHKEIRSEHQGRYFMPDVLAGVAVRAVKRIERRAIEGATQAIAISDFTRREMESFVHTHRAVEVVLGGIDSNYFVPGTPALNVAGKPGAPVIFAARRHVIRTGLENLVAAMPAVLRVLPEAHLYLAGDGPRRQAIELLMSELDIQQNVTLLGRVSDDEVRDWYRHADISVTPTWDLEGFGLSTAEAMACAGVPLVTPVGANPELVTQLPPRHVAPDRDARGLAAGIVELYRHLDKAEIGARARRVAESWDWAAVAASYEQIYAAASGQSGDAPTSPDKGGSERLLPWR